MAEKFMRLAQLETPKEEVEKRGRGSRINSLEFFSPADQKNNSTFIKMWPLVEDSVYSLTASFEENLTRN